MKAVLLINVGTPDSPEIPDVKRYLGEFLMDPLVIDIPFLFRWALVKGVIVRTRGPKSAAAYKSIWTDKGSPLMLHSRDFANRLQDRLYPKTRVFLAMRYGNPSIKDGLEKMREAGVSKLIVAPLYPQFSLAATQSSLEKVNAELKAMNWQPTSRTNLAPFYDDDGFIAAYKARISEEQKAFKPDYVLFSYHGLPERHCAKTDQSGQHCFKTADCCANIVEANKNCYRAQCFASTRLLANALGLSENEHGISFQSRLGRTPWIKPYTDEVLPELAKQGHKRVLVACPAFVADCLETLEEIAIRARADFIGSGGEDLKLVPSLNNSEIWATSLAQQIENLQRQIEVTALDDA